MKRFILIGLILSLAVMGRAQDPVVQQVVEDMLESTGESMSDDTDFQEILDDLEGFRQNPLNLNTATRDELARLHLLPAELIDKFIEYREKTGTIYSLYELTAVAGFDSDLLEKIQPFVSFEVPEETGFKKKPSNVLLARSTRVFSASTNENQAKYEGSPERFYVRMKHTSEKLNFGFVAEKDPGEAFLRKSQKQGFDYNSAFANFGIGKTGSQLFVGDYHVRFGQGLVISQGFSMGKSVEATQVFRSDEGIRSYSSTDENQFFRGAAGKFQLRNFTLYSYVSMHRLDAHLDTVDGVATFGAFQTSGYHRTESELAGKDALTAFDGGGHAVYSYKNWSVGATAIYTRFNALLDRADEPYNQFLPEGRQNVVGGIDWKGSLRNVFFFGEVAAGKNSGKALLSGIVLKPAQNAELALVYRDINRSYYSFYSNAFAESSRINDERGFYLGTKIFPAPHFTLWAYADFFRYRWVKYTTAGPSAGTEFLAQISYKSSSRSSVYIRFFQEEKAQRMSDEILKYNERQKINKLRLNFICEPTEQISLKSRFEMVLFSRDRREQGFLVLQDINYKPALKFVSLNGRIAWFKTDSYNSRIYSYESDVLYTFSVPALYGDGFRTYLNAAWYLAKNLTLWTKFARTLSATKNTDGEERIPEPKSEIKVQLRFQF